MSSLGKQSSFPSREGYTTTSTSSNDPQISQPSPVQQLPPPNDSKCMSLIRNCLGVLFPSLLEGLTHPDQRDQLPTRKNKDKKQYQRVSNPGNMYISNPITNKQFHYILLFTDLRQLIQKQEDEDDEEDGDEESKINSTKNSENDLNRQNDDQSQFFNEFQSWRSNQSNKNEQSKSNSIEMQDIKSSKQINNKQHQKNSLLTMSENEIEKQKNMIQETAQDDIFKDFDQSKQQRKLPAPPQSQRLKQSPQRLQVENKAPQINDLFSELETSLGPQSNINNNDQINQFTLNMGSDNSGHNSSNSQQNNQIDLNNQTQQQNKDILEEQGWDDEININIE